MSKLKELTYEIESRKDDIARAIALGFCDGDSIESNKYYNYFKNILVNQTHTFILGVENFSDSYSKQVDSLIEELNNLLQKDVRKIVLGQQMYARAVKMASPESRKISEQEIIYEKNMKTYLSVGVGYDDFSRLYEEGKLDELNKSIARIKRKLRMAPLKSNLSILKDLIQLPFMSKKFASLSEKYNVNSLEDLLALNTEIDSFFVNSENLTEEKRAIIEENKENFRSRIGASKDYVLDAKTAKQLKGDIKTVYNYNLYVNAFNHSNMRDFFEMYGYGYTKKNIKSVVKNFFLGFRSMGTTGWCSIKPFNFGKGNKRCCTFRSDMLNYCPEDQNTLVLHELIHALEGQQPSQKEFSLKYKNINEALTQYLAIKSQIHLSKDILPDQKNSTMFVSRYDHMLPLVERLHKSNFWKDFIKVKLSGDLQQLEKKLGLDNMKKISRCFDIVARSSPNNFSLHDQVLSELDGILLTMDKTIQNNR